MNILIVDSSILGANSVTRALSMRVVECISATFPVAVVTYRDVAETPIPHLSPAYIQALTDPDAPRTTEIEADIALGRELMTEFKAADVIVIGAPMYNFGIPSTLKAWIDRIAVAGETFRYTAKGPRGLASGKEVIILSGRGSVLAGTPAETMDHQEAHLRTVFGFLGITEIMVVRAEGVATGPDARAAAIGDAERRVAEIRFSPSVASTAIAA